MLQRWEPPRRQMRRRGRAVRRRRRGGAAAQAGPCDAATARVARAGGASARATGRGVGGDGGAGDRSAAGARGRGGGAPSAHHPPPRALPRLPHTSISPSLSLSLLSGALGSPRCLCSSNQQCVASSSSTARWCLSAAVVPGHPSRFSWRTEAQAVEVELTNAHEVQWCHIRHYTVIATAVGIILEEYKGVHRSTVQLVTSEKFVELWNKHKGNGEAYLPDIYNNSKVLSVAQKYISNLFHDSLGFGSAKMIRPMVGIAHVEVLESLKDASKRAECERAALICAKTILKGRHRFDTGVYARNRLVVSSDA